MLNNEFLTNLAVRSLREPIYPDPRFPPSPYYRFFRLLAQEFRPSLSVELGVCGGGGGFHLALGNPEGNVIGVDLTKVEYEEHIRYIEEHCDNYFFLEKDSVLASLEIFEHFGAIDILFIDTIHTYERTLIEFNAFRPYMSDKYVICLDDLLRPGMEEAWKELPGNKLRLDFLHPGSTEGGFGIIYGP